MDGLSLMRGALNSYAAEVACGNFPSAEFISK